MPTRRRRCSRPSATRSSLVILVLGFAVFGEFPDGLALTGIVLIAGSGPRPDPREPTQGRRLDGPALSARRARHRLHAPFVRLHLRLPRQHSPSTSRPALPRAPPLVWLRSVLQTLVMMAIFAPALGMGLVRTSVARPAGAARHSPHRLRSVLFVVALGYMQLAVVTSIVFLAPIFVALAARPAPRRTRRPAHLVRPRRRLQRRPPHRPPRRRRLRLVRDPSPGLRPERRRLPGPHPQTRRPRRPDHHPLLPGPARLRDDPRRLPRLLLVVPTELPHAAAFIAIGIFGSVGHFLLIRAHSHAPATILAPFNYVQIPLVLVIGWLIFVELPDGIAHRYRPNRRVRARPDPRELAAQNLVGSMVRHSQFLGRELKPSSAGEAVDLFDAGGAGDRRGDASRAISQASATSAGVARCAAATSSSAARMRMPRVFRYFFDAAAARALAEVGFAAVLAGEKAARRGRSRR